MKNITTTASILLLSLFSFQAFSQNSDSVQNVYTNTADALLQEKTGLTIGGYGEVHYNQAIKDNTYSLGTLDVHRLIMFMGYNFSSKTQFVSEIEFEHANELWVEQLFLQHKINKYINLRAGLLLIPMGIINEYHEPTTFNGVERPTIDGKIAPTTWREVGFGFQGNILEAKTKYQLYLVNGFNGHDGTKGLFSGSKALRDGRQKGSNAYIHKPALTGKIEFYGAKNLNIGISAYLGESNSKLYANVNKDSLAAVAKADSSSVGISMLGLDARYANSGVTCKGQFYYTYISNSNVYNEFANTDLGNGMIGYYVEVGYNVLKPFTKYKTELVPFVRVEGYNTHYSVPQNITENAAYNNKIVTAGLSYFLSKGAVLKADLQFAKSEKDTEYSKTCNAGFGIMF